MKLEAGMYVRTKSNGIQKVDNEGRINLGLIRPPAHIIKKEELLKCSLNIIDLIEVGDYVNGYIVLDIIKDNLGKTYIECGCKDEIAHNYIYDTFYNEDIKSIVTKEMFSSVEYRVETD